jgi:hypothetical protein
MRRGSDPNTIRIAHVYDLTTSRAIADAYAHAHPRVTIVERQLDSYRQLGALLTGLLDVAILCVTPHMVATYPTGWYFRRLRLEPMQLIGRPGDDPAESASLYDRPIEVFADLPEPGQYNAHGACMTALEEHTGLTLRWLGNPGTFNNCLAALRRAMNPARLLEFDSYARRYAEAGIPVHRPAELQPYYPWSIAWRDQIPPAPVANLIHIAQRTAARRGWLEPKPLDDAPAWLPPDPSPATDRAGFA